MAAVMGRFQVTHIPLIAVVGMNVRQRTIRLRAVGDGHQCDIVLPTHVSKNMLRVLVDACHS